MKKFLLTTFAALVCVTGQGAILAYKLNYSINRNGNGLTLTLRTTGWAVMDTETLEIAFVKDCVAFKRFNIEYPTGEVTDISGSLNKGFSVIEIGDGNLSGNMTIKGMNNPSNILGSPSTMTIGGLDTFQIGEPWFVDEYKGSMIFDKIKTTEFNATSKTFSEAVEIFRLYFLQKGHIQSDTY